MKTPYLCPYIEEMTRIKATQRYNPDLVSICQYLEFDMLPPMRNWLTRLLLRVALSSSKVCSILSLLLLWIDSVCWCPGVYEKVLYCKRACCLQDTSLPRKSMAVCAITTGGKEYRPVPRVFKRRFYFCNHWGRVFLRGLAC